MTVTIAAKKNMTKISKEKQYWQQLAKEYEKKIALLKQAKASVQAKKTPKSNLKVAAEVGIINMKYFAGNHCLVTLILFKSIVLFGDFCLTVASAA